ncbi:tRNA-splicing endonuclease subunit Sen2 [Nasonia vitripennis]|uniref:tRNA-splicing endonuclease subunit Sen2 n=1 Tax=Nasonia vitripennis TaxID=7425 RepID=A0A7M7G9W9_NASVI|nr:tRNA-splicing endonuclease subunit Sen2 [Nasonia vitripennis]
MMELREPKRKKGGGRLVPKSSLPLVFGNKGEITKFHANLTALGSCIADPTEMEIVYKMGCFGKGSLSRSHPQFGRSKFGVPPVIRTRQWQRRQNWISEVQKLSIESFFDDDNNETDQSKNEENISQDGEDRSIDNQDLNNSIETIESNCGSSTVPDGECPVNQGKLASDIELVGGGVNSIQTNGRTSQTNMEVDEVVLDSTEEEDVSEVSVDTYNLDNFDKTDLFNKDVNDEFHKDVRSMEGTVLVLPDSDSDTENYLIDIKPEIKHENFPVRETLHLTFEETFFLMYGLGCLRVIDFDGKFLSISETWEYFCKEQKSFLQKYVAYHYFRSKGWVVKTGLKYGGDYLLYKEGPAFYHSSYIVIIDVLDAVTLKRIESKVNRNMTWNKFIGLERLAETVKKEVLIAQVLWPSTVPIDIVPTSPDVLSQFTVREVLWRRWKITQETGSNDGYTCDASCEYDEYYESDYSS